MGKFINSDCIRALLKERGLTQRALATAIGYSDESSICRSLRRRIVGNDLIIEKIADYLGVDPTYIADDYEESYANLNNLSSERLQNIYNACNEILQKRTGKEVDELKKVKEKYEGKFILVDDILFYIIKFKKLYQYEFYSFCCSVKKVLSPEIKVQFVYGESDWLFVSEVSKKGSIPINRGRIVSREEAEKIINDLFFEIENKTFNKKDILE